MFFVYGTLMSSRKKQNTEVDTSFIKYHSLQASNYSSITCIVCSIKLPCRAEHWRAADAFTAQVGRKEFWWVGLRKKIPLALQPVCSDEMEAEVWGCHAGRRCGCGRKELCSPSFHPALPGEKLRGCAAGLGEAPLKVWINPHHNYE